VWKDRHSAFDPANARAQAEAELLALLDTRATVLNLCGLWGGARDPRHWVARVAPAKATLAGKGSLHMVHGADVARAVLAVHARPETARGQRWLVTDGRVYDWWDLAGAWGKGDEPRWARELMREHDVRALPRAPEVLGRALDGREFWDAFALEPTRARLELEGGEV
jgi:nucleoside-diphosphate-sugar epimerase